MSQLECEFSENLNVRQVNIKLSPKNNGSSTVDSLPYLEELGIKIVERPQPIQFFPNSNELVHRWASYVQGFSANFVQNIINRYKADYVSPVIFDPFAGSGTALIQAKLNGYRSYGVELNPLLQFIAQNKLNTWDVSPDLLLKISEDLPIDKKTEAPGFLKSKKHFNLGVLENLEKLKGGIDSLKPTTVQENKIKNLLLLAFSAILINCSNLKRTPCLGCSKKKKVHDNAPFELFKAKIFQIVHDLRIIQQNYWKYKDIESNVFMEILKPLNMISYMT